MSENGFPLEPAEPTPEDILGMLDAEDERLSLLGEVSPVPTADVFAVRYDMHKAIAERDNVDLEAQAAGEANLERILDVANANGRTSEDDRIELMRAILAGEVVRPDEAE